MLKAVAPQRTDAHPPPATDRWAAWDRFLEASPDAGFMQSSWWADFRSTVGFQHFGVTLGRGPEVVGGAVVMKLCYAPRRCFYYIPEGPALPADGHTAEEVFQAVLASVERRRKGERETVSHLRIEPRWERLPDFVRGFRAVPAFRDCFMEPRHTLCIDLRLTEEEILAQMKPKGRYNIRVAQRHGVSVVEDVSSRGLQDFLRIYRRTTLRQGIAAKPPSYFRTLLPLLSPPRHGSLFFAEHGGTRLATALVVYFGGRATYFFGASLVKCRHVMAPYLLHFEVMRRARAAGHAWYDFWGVAPQDEPDHPWQDISAFKRKFGGRDVALVPTLDYVFDHAAYDEYLASQS